MKTTIEAINTPTIYQFGSRVPELRISSPSSWLTADGQVIQGKGKWYLPIPCEITGGNIVKIPTFELDSTADAPVPFNTTARYISRLYLGGSPIGVFPTERFSSFWVPAVDDLTWGVISELQDTVPIRDSRGPYYLNREQVIEICIDLMGARDFASASRLGLGYSSVDPPDPTHPTFIEESDPRIVRDVGVATLVDGVASVFSAAVLNMSPIQLTSQDDGVSGALRAPIANRVENVSFEIVSSNGADQGEVGWALYNA